MPIRCQQCDTQLSDEANYCLKCGTPVRRIAKKVLALASTKGRVGKTTTAINLGTYLAVSGFRILIVDMSPDADATTGLGFDVRQEPNVAAPAKTRVDKSIYELLVGDGVTIEQVIKTDVQPHLALLPAKVDLYAAEIELVHVEQHESRLKRLLDSIKDQYDFVLIDCPSYLGSLLLINALTAADGVILPLQCEYFALEGMAHLLKTIKRVRDRLNPALELFGVVLTMYDNRIKLAAEVVQEISQHFSNEKFESLIPRNVRLAEAPSYGVSILQHDPHSPGALAYKALAREVIARACQTGDVRLHAQALGNQSDHTPSARRANP